MGGVFSELGGFKDPGINVVGPWAWPQIANVRNFAISPVFCGAGHQIKAAATFPLSLIARR